MNDGTASTDKLIINGQEFAPEDASQLIELGNKYRDIEKNLNTSLDKVVPEYTKATQKAARLDEVERQLAEKDAKLAELSKPKTPIPDDSLAIRESARKYGIVDEDLLKEKGYMTKDEMDEYFNTKQTQQKLVDSILTKSAGLEKEIDGSDGRVPYDSDAVLAYASAYNIDDLSEAYDKMNAKGNAKWKEAQLAKEERVGLKTLRGEGVKTPQDSKVTDDNFKEKWEEMFGSNENQ